MKALLVIDLQNDFGPGGALSVPEAQLLVAPVNTLMRSFFLVIATQDWHPKGHKSFASQHPGKAVGDIIDLEGIPQRIWPDHCTEKSEGADFLPGLERAQFNEVIRKGTEEKIDSYSAFFDNARRHKTELHRLLERRDVDHLYICGVATEYCVLYTVLDALSLGYQVTLVIDACRGLELQKGDVAKALEEMKKKGAQFAFVEELLGLIGEING